MNEEISEFISKKLETLCQDCNGHCCNTSTHMIDIENTSTHHFPEHIPRYSNSNVDRINIFAFAMGGVTTELKDAAGNFIPKPALVELVPSLSIIYVEGHCPLYDVEENKCTIHEDPTYPKVCQNYPVSLQNNGTILIRKSCPKVQ